MSDHTTAFVPMETWCYNSPEIRDGGESIDIGLLAEALIYYECVIANVTNQPQFGDLLKWFIRQDRFSDFLALIRDGTIKIYEYAFATTAIAKAGSYSIWNIQDPIQAMPDTFEQRFLYHEAVQSCLQKSRHRSSLYNALRGKIIEVKADEFGGAVENAKIDNQNPHRNKIILQAFVDELYKVRKIGRPPEINVQVTTSPDRTQHRITWNINFDELSRIAGKSLNFHMGTPLTASAISNRFLLSAAKLDCDLYLGQPMSILVGDKLYESSQYLEKKQDIIQDLKAKVEFPDIRKLVNDGKMGLDDILKFRKKAGRFRQWLQQEPERDRDAIIAYHHEVSKEIGIVTVSRRVLNLFGVLGSGALGATVGSVISGPPGAALGGAAGSAMGYLFDVASHLGEKWKPVVFGNWFKNRIAKIIAEKSQRD